MADRGNCERTSHEGSWCGSIPARSSSRGGIGGCSIGSNEDSIIILYGRAGQFWRIFLPFRVMSLVALPTISPEPVIVMFLPVIVMSPFFVMTMLALPVVM